MVPGHLKESKVVLFLLYRWPFIGLELKLKDYLNSPVFANLTYKVVGSCYLHIASDPRKTVEELEADMGLSEGK